MSLELFFMEIHEIRNCCFQLEPPPVICQSCGNVNSPQSIAPIVRDRNIYNYTHPLETQQQVVEFNKRLRQVPLQMELNLRAITELHRPLSTAEEGLQVIFETMFTKTLLTQYSWFGNKKQLAFRSFGGIFDCLLDAVKQIHPLFAAKELQAFFTSYVSRLKRKLRKDNCVKDCETVVGFLSADM